MEASFVVWVSLVECSRLGPMSPQARENLRPNEPNPSLWAGAVSVSL